MRYNRFHHPLRQTPLSSTASNPPPRYLLDLLPQVFDQNADGVIDRKEWVFVVEYITVQHAIKTLDSRKQPTSRVTADMRAQVPKDMIVQLASEGEVVLSLLWPIR